MIRIARMFVVVALALTACAGMAQSPPTEERKADHDALRALLMKSAQALNTRNLDAAAPLLAPGFTIVTVDNQKLVGLDAVKKYYAALFDGPNAVLARLEAKPVADELTAFLGDGAGIVYGASDDTYVFKDGDQRTMPTRWSAVVMRDGDAWKLRSVHFSANVMDNPLLTAAKDAVRKYAIIGALAGLVVGVLLTLLLRRRA